MATITPLPNNVSTSSSSNKPTTSLSSSPPPTTTDATLPMPTVERIMKSKNKKKTNDL
jgi:hypothetical protein